MKKKYLLITVLLLVLLFICANRSAESQGVEDHSFLSVAEFLPDNYQKDGSVSYQEEVQNAMNAAAKNSSTLIFPPMIYSIDENGFQLHSNLTLIMYNAVFQLRKECEADGQAFYGKDLHNVRIIGGEIYGHLGEWQVGINIRGIYITGSSKNIQIRDMYIHNLTSNAIGVFGAEDDYATDIWVTDVIAEDGCNFYGDYLTKRAGPEKGSLRQDQGLIAFYYVEDFTVRGCRFERSRSDGTHFYRCKNGQFVENKVYSAQMGGYFLETCEKVSASDNIIRDNGSRGVTIERGSRHCLLHANIVANSGREGLWAPSCEGLIITGNIFDRNGRKENGPNATNIWNANITINETDDPTNTFTQDYIVSDNIFYTSDNQVAAIRIDASKTKNIVIKDNQFRGENDLIKVEGEDKDKGNVRVIDNY